MNFPVLGRSESDDNYIHAERSKYQTTWLKCYPWKRDFCTGISTCLQEGTI